MREAHPVAGIAHCAEDGILLIHPSALTNRSVRQSRRASVSCLVESNPLADCGDALHKLVHLGPMIPRKRPPPAPPLPPPVAPPVARQRANLAGIPVDDALDMRSCVRMGMVALPAIVFFAIAVGIWMRSFLEQRVARIYDAGQTMQRALVQRPDSSLVSPKPALAMDLTSSSVPPTKSDKALPVVAADTVRAPARLVPAVVGEEEPTPADSPPPVPLLASDAVRTRDQIAADDRSVNCRLIYSSTPTPIARVAVSGSTLPQNLRAVFSNKKEGVATPRCTTSDRTNQRNLGTALDWAESVREAAETAGQQDKLVYLMHVSGNFEIPQFT